MVVFIFELLSLRKQGPVLKVNLTGNLFFWKRRAVQVLSKGIGELECLYVRNARALGIHSGGLGGGMKSKVGAELEQSLRVSGNLRKAGPGFSH